MNRLLLDTHTFLWWDSNGEAVSACSRTLPRPRSCSLSQPCQSVRNQIKSSLSKLPLALPLREILRDQQAQRGLQLLPIIPAHVFALGALPHYHNDPFDRLLIAQSISEGLPFASVDSQFSPYPVSIVW